MPIDIGVVMRSFLTLTLSALLILTAAPAVASQHPAAPPLVNPPGKVEGAAPSAYRGEYFIPSQEPYRKCVAQREGRHHYWGTGSNGMYLGTNQMTHSLSRGAVRRMTPELRRIYGDKTGRALRDELFATKPTKWGRFYWDMAFYTVLNYDGPASGANHWAGGRFSCHPSMRHWGGDR
jgi:hypothetical protein